MQNWTASEAVASGATSAALPSASSSSESSEAATLDGIGPSAIRRFSLLQDSSAGTILTPGTLLQSRYQIQKMLGQGGMGAVYQARDTELERTIALKLIRPDLATNPMVLKRFKQELILSRNVTHRNVVRIFDLGEAQGTRFITMELVEGEDLRTLLARQGRLPSEEAVGILEQISAALEAAHAAGVIHRDLKPQNVMREPGGRVVVMDFGLARSFESDDGMTQTGALVGTLEYMSPEQALGQPLDSRSDLFAAGLILYELLTGKAPYKADTAIASLMKRTSERAIPASDVDAEVPASLSLIASRCLERDRRDRYQSASDLRSDLTNWRKSSVSQSGTDAALRHRPAASGASRRAPLSVQISLSLPKRSGWMWAALAVIATALFFTTPPLRHLLVRRPAVSGDAETVEGIPDLAHGKFIAVLPLKVVGDQNSLGYLAEGLVDAISAKMFQLDSVHVASSSAVAKAISANRSLAPLARSLGVNLVLQGTMMGSRDRLRVTLNLEDVARNRRLWTQEFSGVSDDVLTMEDQIYASLLNALELKPSTEELAKAGVHPTENVNAYDFYLKGRDRLRGTEGTRDVESAVKLFERALQEDSGFALAYTGLSDADLRLYKSSKERLYAEKAVAAAEKASGLNPDLPEVHLALGSVYNATGRTAEAISELKRALELSPKSDEAYRRLGDVYRAGGHRQDAILAYQSAVNANPYYWANHNTLGGAYFEFGDAEHALQEFQRVTELAPDNPIGHQNIGAVYFRTGKWRESIAAFQKSLAIQPDATIYADIGTANFFLKQYDESIHMFEKAVELSPKDEQLMGNLADAYRARGLHEQANASYEKAIHLAFQQLEVNPKLASVTADLGLYYAKKGDATHALEYTKQARRLNPEDLQLLYYQAEVYSLAKRPKEALETLRQALKRGYSVEEARNDPELESLNTLPEFAKLLAEFKKN